MAGALGFRLSIGLGLLAVALAGAGTSALAQTRSVNANTVNITVGELLTEMAEPTPARSEAIDMYLLGVFDLTEGKSWCSYGQFKVDTLRDEVYRSLSQLQGEALSQRAAPAVSAVLTERFACRP